MVELKLQTIGTMGSEFIYFKQEERIMRWNVYARSCKFSPTPGKSTTLWIPKEASKVAFPMPDRSRIGGVPIAPADRMILAPFYGHRKWVFCKKRSRNFWYIPTAVCVAPFWSIYSTPAATALPLAVEFHTILVTVANKVTCKLLRFENGKSAKESS